MDRYDRQMRIWGHDGQTMLSTTDIGLIGLSQTTIEMVKNFTLAGVKAVHIIDVGELVSKDDIRTNYFLRDDCVGVPLGDMVVEFLKSMNKEVEVTRQTVYESDKFQEILGKIDVAILSLVPGDQMPQISRELVISKMKSNSLIFILGTSNDYIFQSVFTRGNLENGEYFLELKKHEKGKADIIRKFYTLDSYGTDITKCLKASRGRVSGIFEKVLKHEYDSISNCIDPISAVVGGGLFAQMILGCITMSEGFGATMLCLKGVDGFAEDWYPPHIQSTNQSPRQLLNEKIL